MKFAIAGAGALGCRFAYQLHKAGYAVQLLDHWQAHIDRIQQDGLTVDFNGNTKVVRIPICRPSDFSEPVDVIIVLTKAMQLPDMLQSIQPIIQPHTRLVCLLNGIGHEDVFLQHIQAEQLIMGTTIWTAGLAGPGHARLSGIGNLAVQNFVEDADSEQIARQIVDCFNHANLSASYSDDVKYAIWKKACVNGAANATCTLLECNLEQFFTNDYTYNVVSAIIGEFAATAQTQGVTLDVADITDFVITASRKVGAHYPSMYQDLVLNHRLTEVDYINGAVSRIGKAHGIPTPICDMLTQFIHIKEGILVQS